MREANRRLEATLAENAGLHEQLLTQAREAGILDERQRMAREIHDTLAQGLTGIITQLQAAEQAAEDRGRVAAALRRRDPAGPGEPDRGPAVGRRAAPGAAGDRPGWATRWPRWPSRWSALHGVAAQVTTTGTARPMPADAEVALLRAAQEALANVAKHAAADPGRADPVLHGRRGGPGRAGRRRGLRRRTGSPGRVR